jgi:anti-anti-sigma factor
VSSHPDPFSADEPERTNGLDPASPFSLRLERMEDDWVRVRVEGELALTSSDALELAVERELQANCHVLLDFSRLDFIDSAGLRAMTSLVRTARAKGLQLKLSSDMPAHARRLMEIVGLLPFVPIREDENRLDGPGSPPA